MGPAHGVTTCFETVQACGNLAISFRTTMRITEVRLQNDQPVTFGRFTVLVGPNNVGKSRTLKDIQSYISNPRVKRTIINELKLDMPSSLDELLTSVGVELLLDPSRLGHFFAF